MSSSEESCVRERFCFQFCPGWSWLLPLLLAMTWLAPAGRAQSAPPVSLISVLVLYTPQAAAGAGGTPALLSQINQAFLEANTVFQNSQVNARVWLAQAASVNYVESGSVSNDLARLHNPYNSLYYQAQALRNQYAADLVCLVTETGSDWDFYGLQGPSAENACSIIRQPFLTGLNYFPVTLSFNFGCQLERGYADSAGAFPYAYGYSFWGISGTEYSTVEAFSGQRLPFFSNPDIYYDGQAAGVPVGLANAADNALVLNQTAPIVAAFRGSALKVQPPAIRLSSPADGAVVCSGTNLPLTVTTSDATGKVTSVAWYFDGTNLIASVKAAPFNAVWHNVPAGGHTLTAVATDSQHATTVSDPVTLTVLPANDNFANRSPIATLPAVIQEPNDLATAEPGEPDNNANPPLHSLWWTWTAPANTYVVISTSSNSIPLNLTVYTGTNLVNLATVTSEGLSPATPPSLFFRATAGTRYQITAASQNGGSGEVAFTLSPVPGPPNDDFVNRTKLTGHSLTVNADDTYATLEPGEPNPLLGEPMAFGDSVNGSLWYTWTAPANGQVTITGPSIWGEAPLVGVYTGNILTNLSPVTGQFLYYLESDQVFNVQAGVSYQIVWENLLQNNFFTISSTAGPFSWTLDLVTAPPNDNFAQRTGISGSWISLTNSSVLATLEPNEPVHDYGLGSSIWWSWTAPASGTATILSPDDYLDVYTGNALTNLVSVPVSYYNGIFTAQAGTKYAIAASGWQQGEVALSLVLSTVQITSPANGVNFYLGKSVPLTVSTTANDGHVQQVEYFTNGTSVGMAHTSPYRLNWRPPAAGTYALTATATDSLGHQRGSPPISITVLYPPPSNDNFANRARLQGTWLIVTNSNLGATAEPGEPNIAGIFWPDSTWYTWTAPVSGVVSLSSTAGDYFGVFTGVSVTNLTLVSNPYGPVTFAAVAGTTYAIDAVGLQGEVVLKLSLSNLQIISPTNGASFTNGGTISLLAQATATEEPVRQVEFFTNSTSLGVVTNAPYGLTWSNVPGANYALVAVATDNLGHDRSSPEVDIDVHPANSYFATRTDLTGDWISVTNSATNARPEPGGPANLSWDALLWWQWTAPNSGWVTLAVPNDPSYYYYELGVYTGNSLTNLHTIKEGATPLGFAAVAGTTYDIAAADWSDPLNLQLVLSSVLLISPTNGQVVCSGTNLPLSAVDDDAGQSVSQVEFFNNYGYQPVSLGVITNSPYNLVWTNLLPGDYSVTAVATDNQGHLRPSPPAAMTVVPSNDNFTNRTRLTGTSFSVPGGVSNATDEPGEPDLDVPGFGKTVWYTWTAPVTGTYFLYFASYDYEMWVSVYTGDALTNLAAVTNGGADPWSPLELAGVAGTTYQIRVNSLSAGDFILNLQSSPANDSFSTAIPLTGTNATVTGDNTFANGQSLWYSWTAPAAGGATVTLSPAGSFVAWIYAFDKASNFTVVASIGASYPYGNSATFATVPGTTYWIAVADGPGAFSVNLDFVAAPGNDFFANRTPLTGMSLTVTGSTLYATSEPGEPDPFGGDDLSVWYAWTAPADGFVRIQSPQTLLADSLAVFSGGSLSNLTTVAIGGFDIGGEVDFDAAAGETYPIAVIQEYTDPGTADTFTWSLAVSKVAITNPVAGAIVSLGTNLEVDASTIDLEGAVTAVAFYADTNLLGVVTNRPFSMVISNLPAGDFVLSAQGTDEFGGVTTSKDVEIRVAPTNDNFAQRIVFTGTNVTLSGDNSGATTEPGEYLPAGATGRTVWWSWTAPTNGLVTINTPDIFAYATAGSFISHDVITTGFFPISSMVMYPLVAVYTGATLGSLSLYASNTTSNYGFWEVETSLVFPVNAGQNYQISLDGVNGSYGAATIDFSFAPWPPPPANDNFAQRTLLAGSTITTNGTTLGATLELLDPDLGDGLDARTVWYSWTAPASGPAWVEVYLPEYEWWQTPPQYGVYAGTTPGVLIPAANGVNYGYISFYALAGTSYQIEVATTSENEEDFTLSLNGPAAPVMSPTNAVRLSNGTHDIHVVGVVGQSFVIQVSTNQHDWTTIDTDTLLSSSFDYIDATRRAVAYYRVRPLDTVLNDQPFRLLAPTAGPANGFSLNLTGVSGQPFLIQTSTNLVDWFNLTSGVLTGNAFNYTDYDAPNIPRRFYRSVQP